MRESDELEIHISVSESTTNEEKPTGKFYAYVEVELLSKHFDKKEDAEIFAEKEKSLIEDALK